MGPIIPSDLHEKPHRLTNSNVGSVVTIASATIKLFLLQLGGLTRITHPDPKKCLDRRSLSEAAARRKAPTKVLTTVRLDADVLAFFKAQGSGYQTRINDELRKVVAKGLSTRSTRTRARPARAA